MDSQSAIAETNGHAVKPKRARKGKQAPNVAIAGICQPMICAVDEMPRFETAMLETSRLQITKIAEPQKKTYKVAIVGKAPSSLHMAPYGDPEWSIWGLSDLWRLMNRPVNHPPHKDVWFELHNVDTGRKRWPPEYVTWLQQYQDKVPLYVGHKLRVDRYAIKDMTLEECQELDRETKPNKWLPKARMFPVYEWLWRYGTYANNSISFMIGFAIMQGATHIHVFGVDMAQSDPVTGQNGEYEHQRPSCEYMLGFAKGAGIEVFVPGEADLLKCRKLYAFESHGNEDEEEKKFIARTKELRGSIQRDEMQIQQIHASVMARKGALDQMNYDYRRSR